MSRVPRSSVAGVVAALIAVLGAGCGSGASADSTTTRPHARWTSAAPNHYRMTWYENAMVGTTRIVIEVRGGHPVEVKALADDLKLMPVGDFTMETVFAELERAQKSAEEVTASYDSALGYPTSVRVDVDKHAIDDEYEFGIESFRVL